MLPRRVTRLASDGLQQCPSTRSLGCVRRTLREGVAKPESGGGYCTLAYPACEVPPPGTCVRTGSRGYRRIPPAGNRSYVVTLQIHPTPPGYKVALHSSARTRTTRPHTRSTSACNSRENGLYPG
jgi:hypothetical protein